MSKKTIREHKETISPVRLACSLGEISSYINENIQSYGKNASLVWQYEWRSYALMIDREETDEEYKTRVEKEANLAKNIEIREREEFERLSKKFNKNIDA